MKEVLIFIFWVAIRIGPGIAIMCFGIAGGETFPMGFLAGTGWGLTIMGASAMIKEVME